MEAAFQIPAAPVAPAPAPAPNAPRDGVLDAIGATPLVALRRYLGTGSTAQLWLKLESANPGGSVKDRPAAAMLREALQRGELEPGATVIESSSGNMGVGLAQACRYLGLKLICVVDHRSSPEKLATMRAYGAAIELVTEPGPGGDLLAARIARVARLLDRIPGSWWPDQYENPVNPRAHAEGTMREILEALDGRLDAIFVATSTAGTLAGCAACLAEQGSKAELIAVDAEGSALFGGVRGPRPLPGLGAGLRTGISEGVEPDRLLRVGAAEAVIGCRRLIDREAIFAGASTGAVLAGVERVAAELGPGARVAAIAADGGSGYLSTVYDDRWVQSELGLGAEDLRRAIA